LSLRNIPAAGSFAGRLFAGRKVEPEMRQVDPAMWLDGRAGSVATLFEESVLLDEPETVLTLLWAPSGSMSAHGGGPPADDA